jgi:endonuclease/exonuclease/phosphatase family metal-dependent hydrolase
MPFQKTFAGRVKGWMLSGCLAASLNLNAQSNVTVRVMTANLSSGNNQRYQAPGLNIFQGLKPDIVAIQEFNSTNSFGINTAASLSNMIATTFGTNFSYFRETNSGYTIPNGIISRYPILASGSWTDSDSGVNDRGFAWALIDLPGTNDLYVVSVHLKASSGSANATRRAAEAAEVTSNIQTSFINSTNAWIIVAGDMNLYYAGTEGAITTFTTYLSDTPVPTDQGGDPDTNDSRIERYDRILPSFAMTNLLVPVVIGTNHFTNGLVFVSTNYTPLSDVAPVQYGDSYAAGMQHMGVVKDFQIPCTVTNVAVVPSPVLIMQSNNVIRWLGVSNLAYSVQTKTNLAATNWLPLGTAISATTNLSFTNSSAGTPQQFYRVTYP